jgi:hypothetical protein
MGGKEAKILAFRKEGQQQSPLRKRRRHQSQMSTIARIYRDAHNDLGSKSVTKSETQDATGLFNRLQKIDDKAQNLIIKILTRCHSGDLTYDQATLELMRLGLIQHMSTVIRKILKDSLPADPATFRCTILLGKDFLHLVKKQGFMPIHPTYSFPSDLDSTREMIVSKHGFFQEKLEAFASDHSNDFLGIDTIEQNAKNLIRMYNEKNS